MSGVTTHYSIIYAAAADETKAFPAAVDQKAKEKIDEVLYEGNKVANAQVYGALTSRVAGTEYEPSATRAAFVALTVYVATETQGQFRLEVGGKILYEPITASVGGGSSGRWPVGFVCPAGVKWKLVNVSHVSSLESSYLLL